MIKSMTGFGRAESQTKYGLFTSEVRTLNHKFLEITFKLPNSLSRFDEKVKNLIKDKVKRGKVYLNLTHDTIDQAGGNILIDESLAKSYFNKLKKLKRKLNITDPLKIADVVALPGVINHKLVTKDATKMWPALKEVIDKTLVKVIRDRAKEGNFLSKDLTKRIKRIKNIVAAITRNAVYNVKEHKKKLSERVKELSGGYSIDKGRLEVEVALFAKNSDVTEELIRLKNHLANFTRTLNKNGEAGKKLDFIAQELHREINTIGSKSSGFNISKSVIEIKTEIEKIREQLKNIE